MDQELIFCSIVSPNKSSETNILLLVESIRSFSGSLSKSPIWCYTPKKVKRLSEKTIKRLQKLNVILIPFEIDEKVLQFPFSGMVQAASLAEAKTYDGIDYLVWLNSNTIVLQEPKEFLLQEGINLGFSPVHHTLIGSRYEDPVDPFWKLIYNLRPPADRLFPMMTHIDGTKIRPYFNAGIIVTRPGKRVFKAWRDTFFISYRKPEFEKFYLKDPRYRVFMHQAVLSGVILSVFQNTEIQKLSPSYNYPLHLHGKNVSDYRPIWIDELVTVRHEGFYKDSEWHRKIPAKEPLKRWIAEQLIQ